MRYRYSGGVLTTICLIGLSMIAVLAQQAQPSTGSKNAQAFRTPWGEPDLQGIWGSETLTPLERPAKFANRPVLSPEEAQKLADEVHSRPGRDERAERGTEKDVARAYNDYFTPTGKSLVDGRTSLIVDPPDGKLPPMTSEGRQRRLAADAAAFAGPRPSSPSGPEPSGPEDLSNFIRCLTYGAPRLGGAAASYHNYYQIVQTPGYVMFLSEAIHDARIIPLDARPHLPQNIRLWLGDSRGRWEGSTLIVETTNFSPKTSLLGSAENLHVVERFTRTALDQINYEITLTDPTTWTVPLTAVVRLKRTADKIYEDACHEGNERVMTGILAGARAAEKAAAR